MSVKKEKYITDDIIISNNNIENLGLNYKEMMHRKKRLTLIFILLPVTYHFHLSTLLEIQKYNKANQIYNPLTFLIIQMSLLLVLLARKRTLEYKKILNLSFSFLFIFNFIFPFIKSYHNYPSRDLILCNVLLGKGTVAIIIQSYLYAIFSNFTSNLIAIPTIGQSIYGITIWGFNYLKINNLKTNNKIIENFTDLNFIIGSIICIMSFYLINAMYKNEYFLKRMIQIGEIKEEDYILKYSRQGNSSLKDYEILGNKEKHSDYSSSLTIDVNTNNSTNSDNKLSNQNSPRSIEKTEENNEENVALLYKYSNEIEENILYEPNDISTVSLKNDVDILNYNEQDQSSISFINPNSLTDLLKNQSKFSELNLNKMKFTSKCSSNFAKDNEEEIIIHFNNEDNYSDLLSLSITSLFTKLLNINICIIINNLVTYSFFPYFLLGKYKPKNSSYSLYFLIFLLFESFGRKCVVKLTNMKVKLYLFSYFRIFFAFISFTLCIGFKQNAMIKMIVIFLFGFTNGMTNTMAYIVAPMEISNSYLKEKCAFIVNILAIIGMVGGLALDYYVVPAFVKHF